jgi:DNA primase
MGIVHRLTKNLVLAYDSDRAGINAAKKAARIALSLGMNTKAVEMPQGYDPADYVKEFGKEGWKTAVSKAVPIVEVLTKRIINEEVDFFKKSIRIRDEVLSELAYIPSAIEQEYYLKRISELSTIPYIALQKDFQSISQSGLIMVQGDEIASGQEQKQSTSVLEKVFGFMWYLEDRENFDKANLLSVFIKRFSGKLYDEWYKKIEPKKQELVFESEIDVTTHGDVESRFETVALDVLRYLRPIYKRSIDQLEKQNDQEKMKKVMLDFDYILRMIQDPKILQQELYGTKKENN